MRLEPAANFARRGSQNDTRRLRLRTGAIRHVNSPLSLPIVFLIAFAILLLLMPRDLFVFDEGIVLVDSIRVFQGDVIHRDFYSIYGPGQYYVVGALFRLFGQQFIVERLYDITIRSLGIVALFVILRACLSPITVLTFTALGGLWMIHTLDAPIYPAYPCIPLSLLGTYLLIGTPTRPISVRSLVGAGATAGLCALFRYDVGFLQLVAHAAAIGWRSWRTMPAADRRRYWFKAMATYSAAAALAFSPAAILILANSAIDGFIADVIDYPAKYYARMRSLPFPGLWGFWMHPMKIGLYFPLAAGGLTLFELLRFMRDRRAHIPPAISGDDEGQMNCLIAFGSLSLLFFLKGMVRINEIQMLPAIVPALIVFAVVTSRGWRSGIRLRAATVLGALVVLVPSIDALKEQVGHSYRAKDRAVVQWLAARIGLIEPLPDTETACRTAATTGIAKLLPDYVRAVNYLDAYSRPDERILIGLKRHDIVPGNAMALYFVANRRPATHWAEYDPGQQTRADIQLQMIDELKRYAVRWIVRDGSFDYHNEPNDSSKSSGVKLLDHYIDQNYREVAASGKVSIWLSLTEDPPTMSDLGACLPQAVKVKGDNRIN
jgi:hypothetical protein